MNLNRYSTCSQHILLTPRTLESYQITIGDSSYMVLSTGVGRRVFEAMYTRDSAKSNVFMCRCGTKRKCSRSSYTNSLSNFQSFDPDAYQTILLGEEVSQAQLDDYFVTSKARHFHGWIDLIIDGLHPYSFAEKRIIQMHVKHEPPSLTGRQIQFTILVYLPLFQSQKSLVM